MISFPVTGLIVGVVIGIVIGVLVIACAVALDIWLFTSHSRNSRGNSYVMKVQDSVTTPDSASPDAYQGYVPTASVYTDFDETYESSLNSDSLVPRPSKGSDNAQS